MAWITQITKVLLLGIIIVVTEYIFIYLRSPLRRLPGPFLARFSNIWRLVDHYRQTHIETQRRLHEKYGDVVRLGPNFVSIADDSLIKTIYSTRGTFLKSDYYSVNDALSNGQLIQNMFSTRSNEFHARSVKPVQKLYSLQGAIQLEPLMDDDVQALCTVLEHKFICDKDENMICDISEWISYFAWDFLGHMTWSERVGFMEQGKDIGGMIKTAENVMRYFSVHDLFEPTLLDVSLSYAPPTRGLGLRINSRQVGQVPVLDKWLGKNPYFPRSLHTFEDFSVAAGMSVNRFMERMKAPDHSNSKRDFLDGFLNAKKEFPDLVGDNEVIGYMIISILGGADTLAIVMKAIVYHILRTPAVKVRLISELRSGGLIHPAPYATLEKLSYLNACVLEGLRMHPVVGHILERIVPAGGLLLKDGTCLPSGTIVGVNPWVIHYQECTFGSEPQIFKPERWLRGEDEDKPAYQTRLRRMKDADLSFGGGNRVCLGRPLGLVEVHKVVATLFGKYDIDLENDQAEWTLNKQWFVWPHNIRVKLRPISR